MAFSQSNGKVKHQFSQVSHSQACLLRTACFSVEMLSISIIVAVFHTDLTSYVAASLPVCRATMTLHLCPNRCGVRSRNHLFSQSLGGWRYPIFFMSFLSIGASSLWYIPSLFLHLSPIFEL